MSYTIKLTNGTVFAIVPDGTINTNSSMTLIGKNYAGYGQFLDDNFIHLLESGSNDSPPPNPLIGQLWWDSANKLLKVYTGSNFRGIASNIASTTPPPNPVPGDMWFNTSNDTLNVYSGSTWVTIGPSIINGTGTIPAVIEDTFGVNHNVVEILIGATIVGIVSKDPAFTPLVAIPGFITVGPGYNVASSIAGVNQFFQGTATNALNLDGFNANAFMSAVRDTGTTGTVSIFNNGGLITGQQQNFSFFNIINDGVIQNRAVNGNIIISLNIGGSQVNVANFYGANGNVKFFNDVSSNTIHANTIYGDGGNITNISYSNIVGGYGNSNVALYLGSGTVTTNIQTSGYFIGDGSQLTNIPGGNVIGGYGNAQVSAYLSNPGSAANIVTSAFFIGDGTYLRNIPGGNIIGGYSNTNAAAYFSSGTVTSNIQTSGYFVGDGRFLTNINSSNIIGGYGNANVSSYLASGTVTTNINTAANSSAAYFIGNGSFLTNINAGNVVGGYSNANAQSFFAAGSPANIVTSSYFVGDGSQLTNLPLGNYSNSNVAAYLPTYNGSVGGSIQIGSLGVGGGASGTAGEIRATNNITAFYSSDERLKENFVNIDQPLEKAKAIRGYFFDWTEKYIEEHGGEDGFFVRKHDVGVKAQEVQKVMPEVVAQRQDGYLGVRYEMLVPLLFECINTLVERIEKLESKKEV